MAFLDIFDNFINIFFYLDLLNLDSFLLLRMAVNPPMTANN